MEKFFATVWVAVTAFWFWAAFNTSMFSSVRFR